MEERKLLLISSQAKKPDADGSGQTIYADLLKPMNDAALEAVKIKDSNRDSPVFNHLSAVAEGVMVLAWVTVDNRPYKHVEDCLGSAQYYGNRVLKEQKDKWVLGLPGQPGEHHWAVLTCKS